MYAPALKCASASSCSHLKRVTDGAIRATGEWNEKSAHIKHVLQFFPNIRVIFFKTFSQTVDTGKIVWYTITINRIKS